MATVSAEVRDYGEKAKMLDYILENLKKYRVIGILDLTGTRATIIHEFRRRLRGRLVLKVVKKTLLSKALERLGMTKLKEYVDSLKKPIGLIFTDINAFELKLELDKSRVLFHARPGERADIDVVVPEMNTGLPPGPILSEFGKMRIPTKIEGGQIWIARETVVAKKGDEISAPLASLLVRLDIKSVYKGLNILAVWESGILLKREDLEIDIDAIKSQLVAAHGEALSLAAESGLPEPEVMPAIIAKAHLRALALASESAYPAAESIGIVLAKAASHARALESLISS